MCSFSGVTDLIGQRGFDIHVHIFQFHRPIEIARFNSALDLLKAIDYGLLFLPAGNSRAGQHARMSD